MAPVAAMVRVLAWELSNAMGTAKKKRKKMFLILMKSNLSDFFFLLLLVLWCCILENILWRSRRGAVGNESD